MVKRGPSRAEQHGGDLLGFSAAIFQRPDLIETGCVHTRTSGHAPWRTILRDRAPFVLTSRERASHHLQACTPRSHRPGERREEWNAAAPDFRWEAAAPDVPAPSRRTTGYSALNGAPSLGPGYSRQTRTRSRDLSRVLATPLNGFKATSRRVEATAARHLVRNPRSLLSRQKGRSASLQRLQLGKTTPMAPTMGRRCCDRDDFTYSFNKAAVTTSRRAAILERLFFFTPAARASASMSVDVQARRQIQQLTLSGTTDTGT